MELEKLSKETEREIVGALENAISLTNSGTTPNDALLKVAQEHRFPPEIVKRMVEAYNTSKTLAHFKSASAEERGASFPLADAKIVLDAMYPEKVVAPAVKAASVRVPNEYLFQEDRSFYDRPSSLKIEPVFPKVAKYEQDRNIIDQKLLEKKAGLIKRLDSVKSEYRQAIWKVNDLVKEASEYFTRLYRTPFETIHRNVVGEFGEVSVPLVEMLYKQARLKEPKYSGPIKKWSFDMKEEPYPLLVEAISHAKEASSRAREVINIETAILEFKKKAGLIPTEPVIQSTGLLHDSLFDASHTSFEENPLVPAEKSAEELPVMGKGENPNFSKSALDIPGTAESAVMSALGLSEPGSEGIKAKAISESTDPIHENRLRSISTRAMLNDFMANDPIISGYDPDQIISSYNQFAQLAPHVAQQPAVARAVLQRMLQSSNIFEPHEATSLVELNKSLQSQGLFPQLTGSLDGGGKKNR